MCETIEIQTCPDIPDENCSLGLYCEMVLNPLNVPHPTSFQNSELWIEFFKNIFFKPMAKRVGFYS